MKVYIDVCCLNRPFDGTSQARVVIEAAAMVRVFELIESSSLSDYSSEMARVEIERIQDLDRRRKVKALLPPNNRIMPLSKELLDMAEDLMLMGFSLADSVHLSAARRIGVDVFLTVDDRLLKRAVKHVDEFGFRVINPASFLREFEDDNDR
jgi:predicted nucleic acid-binding protein